MNKEVFDKVSKCNSVDEVLALAKSNGKDITREEAEEAYNITHYEGELGDDEINNVAGGAQGCEKNAYEDEVFHNRKDVYWVARVGDRVEVFVNPNGVGNETYTCKVERLKLDTYVTKSGANRYRDAYQVQDVKTGYSHDIFRIEMEKK